MSGDENNNDNENLPWGFISEFLTLPELLVTRQVSHAVADAVHDVSPQKCGALLEQALRRRNIHLLPYRSWDRPIQDQPSVTDMLIRDVDEHTASLDGMLRCFRVLKHLPQQVAVAFSGKYGRHCVPMEWDSTREQTQLRLYEPCSRRRCRTCRLRVPVCDDPKAEINAHIQIENKHGERMDMTRFYCTCVPNLPRDLICPSCRRNDERTLVLSAVSYRSSASASGRTLLTYTPYPKEDDTEEEENSDNDGQGLETATRKKQKLKKESVSFSFPDMRDDVALPTRWEPLNRSNDAKHGIAIHCVSCEQFGVATPAGPCMDARFPCHDRKRTVMVGKHASTLGGVFVRTKCSNRDCNHPVACEACSHRVTHPAYERERAATRSEAAVEYKNRCQTCDLTYCSTCSWLATVCHHW
jgi:hypothetical protein